MIRRIAAFHSNVETGSELSLNRQCTHPSLVYYRQADFPVLIMTLKKVK
jgi:hypothetical protein